MPKSGCSNTFLHRIEAHLATCLSYKFEVLETVFNPCPEKAISLFKKRVEVKPPETREDLYDTIMVHKKGTVGKLKLTGKLVVDAIRTGKAGILK